MYYSEEIIQEVISRNNIEDVIGGYVKLQKKGSSYMGLCPFHNERTPSFSVSAAKGLYHCFGCGAGGNVISFIMNYENLTYGEAIVQLAERAGIALPVVNPTEERRERSKKARLLDINKEAGKYFYYSLRDSKGKSGLDYLLNRQLTMESINQWGLGYAGKSYDGCVKYLRSKGYSDEEIVEASLGIFDEKHGMRDKFYNRVMFPIMDLNNHIIGFGGRLMGDGEPKYLNSKETPVFDKGRNLYGMQLARRSRKDYFILCEGYMDVIALHQAGFNEAVASLGTAFTPGQAVLIRRYVDTVILSYDSDGAGRKAALRAIDILKEAGLRARVLDLKPYKDPDEFLKNLGREELLDRLENARNSFYFQIDIIKTGYNMDDPQEKSDFYNEVARRLCEFEDLERDNYTEAVAREFAIDAVGLKKLIMKNAADMSSVTTVRRYDSGIHRDKKATDGIKQCQALLLTWLYENPELYKKIKEYISSEDFTESIYRDVAGKLFDGIETGSFNLSALIAGFTETEQQREVTDLFTARILNHQGLPFDMDNMSEMKRDGKAFKEILVKVKTYAYEKLKNQSGDVSILPMLLEKKRQLEMLKKLDLDI